MGFKYYKILWPDNPIPPGEPCCFFYEVESGRDIVLRTVEDMQSGELIKNDLGRENRIGPPCVSLVGGPFLKTIEGHDLELIEKAQFEALFAHAIYIDQIDP